MNRTFTIVNPVSYMYASWLTKCHLYAHLICNYQFMTIHYSPLHWQLSFSHPMRWQWNFDHHEAIDIWPNSKFHIIPVGPQIGDHLTDYLGMIWGYPHFMQHLASTYAVILYLHYLFVYYQLSTIITTSYPLLKPPPQHSGTLHHWQFTIGAIHQRLFRNDPLRKCSGRVYAPAPRVLLPRWDLSQHRGGLVHLWRNHTYVEWAVVYVSKWIWI